MSKCFWWKYLAQSNINISRHVLNVQPCMKPVDQDTWKRIRDLGILRNLRGARGRSGFTSKIRSNSISTAFNKSQSVNLINIQDQAITGAKRSEGTSLNNTNRIPVYTSSRNRIIRLHRSVNVERTNPKSWWRSIKKMAGITT